MGQIVFTRKPTGGGGSGTGDTISAFNFVADGNGLLTRGRIATSAGNFDLLHKDENIAYNQTGTGFAYRTIESKLRETVSPEDFGAVGNGVADDTAAIQAAVNYIDSIGGGSIFFSKPTYLISDCIVLYSRMYLYGNNCTITHTNNAVSFFKPSSRIFNSHIKIEGFRLDYQTQNTTGTLIPGISLGETNTTNYFIQIIDTLITQCNVGIGLLSAANSFAFYVEINHVEINQPYNYGTYFAGDPVSGAGTNYNMQGVWVIGKDDFTSTCTGFYINGVTGFYANNLSIEKIKNRGIVCLSTDGSIDNLYLENNRLYAYGNVQALCSFSNCQINIGAIVSRLNQFYQQGGDTALVNFNTGFDRCSNTIHNIIEVNTTLNTTTGTHYTVHLDTAADILGNQGQRVYSKMINGVTLTPNFYDNTPIPSQFGIMEFDGKIYRGNTIFATVSTGGTITTRAGVPVKSVIITGTAADTVSIGTTAAGTDIVDTAVLDADGKFISNDIQYWSTAQTLHISGNTNPVTIILPI